MLDFLTASSETGAPKNAKVNRQMELMHLARARATFDPRLLTYMIYGGEEIVRQREAVLSRVEAVLNESDTTKLPRLFGESDRASMYYNGLRSGKALMEDEVQHRHGLFDRVTHQYNLINASPFGLHPVMFIPTLKLQADEEQLAYWLPLAESGKIIGTYCQTELGHGTFIRGLETTATFDRTSDEIIIHSPTVSSTKYWPGGLGYSCSHAVVMAQLVVNGQHHGLHPFIVQLRSLTDYRPKPGIELGDIGLKMGLNCTDNGYAVFNQVRIPRRHMLMKNAHLSREGVLTTQQTSHDKSSYSTMIFTRNVITNAVAFQLAQAATIAIRYSTVREQGNLGFGSNGKEVSIMAYKSQQYRLLTIMSRVFAILFASKACQTLYDSHIARQKQNDNGALAYTHITVAGLKAYASQVAADGAEDARKCCGGHGYSALSGLPDIVANLTSIATLEGENYVMYQQTARYLMRVANGIRRKQPVDTPLTYLYEGYWAMENGSDIACTANGLAFSNSSCQLEIFRHRATRLVFDCERLVEEAQTQGKSYEDAWNTHMMSLIAAARAHMEYFVLKSFIDAISNVKNTAIHIVLTNLCDLFALSTIESPWSIGALGFLEDSYISSRQLADIRATVNTLLDNLLDDAIALTDAWNFSDASLSSALGRKDGNVYETLLSWTRQIPLNVAAKSMGNRVGFQEYIKPIIHSKL